jgi:hypothetical protein
VLADNQSRYRIGTLAVGTPVGFELSGPVEVVRPASARCDSPDVPDIPDLTPRAFRDADGKVNLISSHYISRRMLGASLNTVRIESDCHVIYNSANDPNYDNYRFHEWMASTYTQDGQTIYALIHNEWYGYLSGDTGCIAGPNVQQWANAITLVVSDNKGASYKHPDGDYIVVRPPVRWTLDDPAFKCNMGTRIVYGAFAPSNIIKNKKDNYYYALYQSERDPHNLLPPSSACLMRTKQLDSAAAWEIWQGKDPQGNDRWNSAPGAIPLPLANIGTIHESVTYNTYLKKYILVGQTWTPRHGVYFSTSSNLTDWSQPVMITPAPDDFSDFIYPALLDPTDTSRNFENTGQTPYFYYVRKVGGMNVNREIVRRRIRFISVS